MMSVFVSTENPLNNFATRKRIMNAKTFFAMKLIAQKKCTLHVQIKNN